MFHNLSSSNSGAGAGRVRAPASHLLPVVVIVTAAVAADGLIRCLRRTTGLAHEIQRLAGLARTDPLTGLHNRLHVEEQLAGALSAARRHHQPLSVLFIDIDSFKQINDVFGYEAGDDILRAVADQLRTAIRAEDIIGRWGGEEFLAILPATDLAGGVAVAERLRVGLDQRIAVGEPDIHVTVSVGCASGVGDPADLIRQASSALRRAKRAGKNRVVAHDAAAD